MSDKTLYYAVTRVHSQELGLLNMQDLQQLLDAPTLEDAFQSLRNHGWGDSVLPPLDIQALLNYETKKVWDLLEELTGDVEQFNVLRYSHDFNNLKAAIKMAYAGEDFGHKERYFLPFGTVAPEQLIIAAQSHDFSQLLPPMDTAGQRAFEALAHTASGQSCDIIVDAAALETIYAAGTKTGIPLLIDYATLTVDAANIKTALRAQAMKKGKDFLDLAIADCGSLHIDTLKAAALSERGAIYDYLQNTDYRKAVPVLEESMAAFERWCDNRLMEQIKPQRHAISGLEPLAAYVLARENEIAMVQLVLSAKINHLNRDVIKERMREMYV